MDSIKKKKINSISTTFFFLITKNRNVFLDK